MADTTGLGLDQAQIADAINRQKLGTQRQRNEMMRQGTTDPNSFAMNNSSQITQAQQPQEYWGAGRQLMSPDIDMSLLKGVGGTTSNLGGQDYYYSPYDMSKTSWGTYDPSQDTDLGKGQYQINRDGQNLGTGYKSLADTLKDYGLQDKVTNNSMKDWELLGQVLNYGGITGDTTTPHSQGGNNIADPIKGLNTLYGSKPIISDGKLVGYSQEQNSNPLIDTWNQQNQWTTGGGWFSKPKQHFQWDVGGGALAHNFNDPNWWMQNARSAGDGNMFIKNNDIANSPGWTNSDMFQRDAGYQESGGGFGLGNFAGHVMKWASPLDYAIHGGKSYFDSVDQQGLYGAVFDKLDPFLDSVDPLHNEGQNLLGSVTGQDSQKKNFETIAPAVVSAFVPGGAYINAANSANQGNYGAALASIAASAISNYAPTAEAGAATETATDSASGAAANGMGNTAAGSTGVYGSGTSLGSLAADKAAQGFINGTVTNTLANGGNLEAALKSSAFSAASGAAGNYLANNLTPQYGEIAGKALGGAASGGLNSLFSGGNAVNGSLFGGMSGGLHGFLNSTAKNNDSFNNEVDKKNYNTAQSASKLAKAIFNKGK